jgi:hypothetical protein
VESGCRQDLCRDDRHEGFGFTSATTIALPRPPRSSTPKTEALFAR